MQGLEKLGIRNLHSVFGRGVRGETLARRCYAGQMLERVGDAGVKVVIDFRTADHNDKFARRCADVGIAYHHIPTDSQVMPPEELFETLPRLFEVLDGDGFYISCQQGLHRTDIALALYYYFHNDSEVPEMVGHYKKGLFRCDDIGRRVNSMRPFFPEVGEELFLQRRKRFLAFNREKAEAYKDVVAAPVATTDVAADDVAVPAKTGTTKTFSGDLDFLSNFYPAPVVVGGIRYGTSEAAYQAQKSLDEAVRTRFAEYPPGKAKRKGQQIAMRPDWYEVRLDVMDEVIRAKFTQNPELAAKLVATGTALLEEGNSWGDTFWGVDVHTGKGENNLGKILMKVREELRQCGRCKGPSAMSVFGRILSFFRSLFKKRH
jgi:ribA/ribD-fused uncharacterized protein